MTDWWSILGGGAIIVLLVFIVCLPLICTIILGTYLATIRSNWYCLVEFRNLILDSVNVINYFFRKGKITIERGVL